MSYELQLHIKDDTYVDNLVIALVRQRYNVYYNEEDSIVCCTIEKDDLTELRV